MAGQAPQQQQNADNSLGMLWGIALTFAVIWGLWYFFHDPIAGFILKIRYYEARLIALFSPKAQQLANQLNHFPPSELSASDLVNVSSAIGRYLRYPVAVLLSVFGMLIYFARATLRFKRNYSIDALVETEKINWPQITPVLNLNLVKIDIDQGPWAMALSPLQFAKQNNLIRLERMAKAVSTATMTEGGVDVIATLKPEEARHVFIMQLGQYWEGVSALSPAARALFAIFAARIARDRKGADQLLLQIARSSAGLRPKESGKSLVQRLNFQGVDSLLMKHINHKIVNRVIQRHAYTLPVMASMLQFARRDGVLASSEFLWLKPIDRSLWFMLNSVGRQTAYPEVAGPFAHWILECAIGHKLLVPMVNEAVNALEFALKEVRLTEDFDEDSSWQ